MSQKSHIKKTPYLKAPYFVPMMLPLFANLTILMGHFSEAQIMVQSGQLHTLS